VREAGLSLNPHGLVGSALYLTVFIVIFLESGIPVGFWLPGDTVLFVAGLVAADPATRVSVGALAAGVTLCAAAGSVCGYLLGRRVGRPTLDRRYGQALRRAESFTGRWGTLALLVSRFVPWARTFVPIVLGSAAMPARRFLLADVSSALIWGCGLVLLGYAAASTPALEGVAIAVAVVAVVSTILVPAGIFVVRRVQSRRRQSPEPRAIHTE
jgi:membrane-associated protein